MVAILVVVTFVLFIVISSLLQRRQVVHEIEQPLIRGGDLNPSFPLGYFFSPNHVWAKLESTGVLKVGTDEMLHRFFGKPDGIHMKSPGDFVRKGEVLVNLSRGDKDLFIASPVTGVVQYVNSEAEKKPKNFTGDPYETGWLYLIKPSNLAEELKSFKLAEQAKSWMAGEMNRLKDFVQLHVPQRAMASLTMADGGLLVEGVVDYLDSKGLREFEREFLLNPDVEE
jgi:glycine cleavage system H lipoate-binding protein